MNCFGCGAMLQDTKPTAIGFIPNAKLNQKKALCKRCFTIKHYNASDLHIGKNFKAKEKIMSLNIKHAIIVFVVDIYSLSFLEKLFMEFKELLKLNKVWILVNKIDLLPKSINHHKLKNKLITNFKNQYKYDYLDIISTHKMINTTNLVDKINKLEKNIYLLGFINSGKSSIINSILQTREGANEKLILKSYIPSTTLDKIEIAISKSHKLVDLPGISSTINKYMSNDEMKKIYKKNQQKTITFQLKAGQKIYFDSFGYVEFISGHNTNITFYMNNVLKLHRTKASTIKPNIRANFKLLKHSSKDWYFKFNYKKMVDIEIPHLGFMRFKTSNQKIKINSVFNPMVRNTII